MTDPLYEFFGDCPVDALVTVRHAEELVAWIRSRQFELLVALGGDFKGRFGVTHFKQDEAWHDEWWFPA